MCKRKVCSKCVHVLYMCTHPHSLDIRVLINKLNHSSHGPLVAGIQHVRSHAHRPHSGNEDQFKRLAGHVGALRGEQGVNLSGDGYVVRVHNL